MKIVHKYNIINLFCHNKWTVIRTWAGGQDQSMLSEAHYCSLSWSQSSGTGPGWRFRHKK
ncbi:MAG TPA: hypothetical protein ENI08_02050 [Candidatus Dependentiae bacterium]|nr:hypothetical protein [Candidatus Dependentiae bacterium]